MSGMQFCEGIESVSSLALDYQLVAAGFNGPPVLQVLLILQYYLYSNQLGHVTLNQLGAIDQ